MTFKIAPKSKKIELGIASGLGQPRNLPAVLRRSAATCPVCGYTTPASNVRAQFKGRQGGAADARLLAVVTASPNGRRSYRLAKEEDLRIIAKAVKELGALQAMQRDIIPTEPLPYLRSIFNIHLLDVTHWADLFTPRQLVALIKLAELVRRVTIELEKQQTDRGLGVAITTCLALAVDKVAAQFSSLSWWQPKGEFVVGTFGRQALGIVWDFAEIRPVGGASGDFDGAIDWVGRFIEASAINWPGHGTAQAISATNYPLSDDSVAAVVTDPPYYDAVPYADLSDFFYVWLKRMLKESHSSYFADVLTPKDGEIVQLAERNVAYSFKTKEYFEQQMQKALTEARRITTPSGVAVIVFAHKTTQGWEAMLSSIINSGWVVTASWPIDTERAVRMRATNSAALASSIHLVCRPREDASGTLSDIIGDWREVLAELPQRIHDWMPRLAAEGIVGADAIFACLGPALEVFSRYAQVQKPDGSVVALKEYLERVWETVSKEALNMVFAQADTGGFEEDARLTAIWLWTLGATSTNGSSEIATAQAEDEVEDDEETPKKQKISGYILEYDAARKIAQGLGAHLEDLKSVVEVNGEKARLLPVKERAEFLFGKASPNGEQGTRGKRGRKKDSKTQLSLFDQLEKAEEKEFWGDRGAPESGKTVLDRVHQAMILFGSGRSEALRRFLVDEGVGRDERFWRLAQALSALYPAGTEERRWVEGVMARKKGLGF